MWGEAIFHAYVFLSWFEVEGKAQPECGQLPRLKKEERACSSDISLPSKNAEKCEELAPSQSPDRTQITARAELQIGV
jgi:hypothetical protein